MNDQPLTTALSLGPCPSFAVLAGRYLAEYQAKIVRVTSALDDSQMWWRPSPKTNSIGNQLLHLAGNLSLWIGQGIGGHPFDRDRRGELTADRSHDKVALLATLDDAVELCQAVVDGLSEDDLDRSLEIQGYTVDVRGALFHAVEHMSYHTGQVAFLAKQLLGPDDGFELYPQHAGE